MKKFLVIMGFCVALPFAKTQAQNMEQGAAIFSAGYGFMNLSKSFFTSAVDGLNESDAEISSRAFGPLYVKAEYGVGENFGIGLNFAYIGMNADWDDAVTGYNYKVSRNNMSFMLRFNRYWYNSDNIDIYTGMGIGYRTGGWKLESDDPDFLDTPGLAIPFAWEGTVGLRGYFTENIAAYGEVGLSKGLIQVGVSYKL